MGVAELNEGPLRGQGDGAEAENVVLCTHGTLLRPQADLEILRIRAQDLEAQRQAAGHLRLLIELSTEVEGQQLISSAFAVGAGFHVEVKGQDLTPADRTAERFADGFEALLHDAVDGALQPAAPVLELQMKGGLPRIAVQLLGKGPSLCQQPLRVGGLRVGREDRPRTGEDDPGGGAAQEGGNDGHSGHLVPPAPRG